MSLSVSDALRYEFERPSNWLDVQALFRLQATNCQKRFQQFTTDTVPALSRQSQPEKVGQGLVTQQNVASSSFEEPSFFVLSTILNPEVEGRVHPVVDLVIDPWV
ncbi:hypothetical protein DM791_07015 [Paenarthrobacter nitroguajacolicus]|nr:hypothetical protein [Paenarthrobacter nitroguajacolicus]